MFSRFLTFLKSNLKPILIIGSFVLFSSLSIYSARSTFGFRSELDSVKSEMNDFKKTVELYFMRIDNSLRSIDQRFVFMESYLSKSPDLIFGDVTVNRPKNSTKNK